MNRYTSIRIENGVVTVSITEEGLPENSANAQELTGLIEQVKDIRKQVQSSTFYTE